MHDFILLRPLWLLAIIPAMVLWWLIYRRQDAASAIFSLVDAHLLEHLTTARHRNRWFRPVNMLLVVWVIAIAVLAGPSWRLEPSPFADDEAGLVVVLKVSETMNATDLAPSRLERAKLKLRDLLEQRPGGSAGLIVYSGSAHLVMPLTHDDQIITSLIEDLTPNLMPVDGDSLADALILAESVLESSGTGGSILVIADTVAVTQVDELSNNPPVFPVQFLAVQGSSTPMDSNLKRAASALKARTTGMRIDATDVELVLGHAQSQLRTTVMENGHQRRQDNGYTLLPLLALCLLLWARKGWVIA